jgi:hypothetical protein
MMRLKPWNIRWNVKNLVRKLTGGKSLECERAERMQALRELMVPGSVRMVKPAMTRAYFDKLADDFALYSLTVEKTSEGKAVVSSLEDPSKVKGLGLFSKVASELPGARYMVVKSGDKTHVFYPNNGHVFVIEAEGNVSPSELYALALRANKGVKSS